MNIKAPKGTTDLYAEEVLLWQKMESVIRDVCRLYNFSEFRTPIFENTNLFVRSIGEVTDIVEKEMYTFESKGGESVTLRPEGTASIVRSILEGSVHKQNPLIKAYYLGPMFRYERPQAGRSRQFHQFGVECVGSSSPNMDVEVIGLANSIYKALGIDDVSIRINSIGTETCRDNYRSALKKIIEPNLGKYCKNCQKRFERNVFRMLDCKSEVCGALNATLPPIDEYLTGAAKNHFDTVKQGLSDCGIEFVCDPTIVRGFDYYSNTVFELKHSALGAQDAIGGGGRYDGLVSDLGGPQTGAVGFAIGLERTIMAMKAVLGEPEKASLDSFVVAMGEGTHAVGQKLCQALRQKGESTDMDHEGKSFKAQMRMANRLNAKRVYIVGEDELKNKQIAVKNMEDSSQSVIELDTLVEL